MAFCAIAGAGSGTAGAQGLWEDGAFALYRQAVEAMNKKDYEAADRLVAEAIKQYPNHVLAYYLRGQAALAQSRWDAAVAAFARVTELYPGSIAGFKSLGIASEELGRTDDAARAYETALKLSPTDDELRARLGFLLLRAGREAQGLALLRELADRDTKNADVWIALARNSYDKGDYPATEKVVRARDGAARRRPRVVQSGRGAAQARQPGGRAPGLRARRGPRRDPRAGDRGDRADQSRQVTPPVSVRI